MRQVRVLGAEALFDHRPNGTTYVRSPRPLGPYPDRLIQRLEHWARTAPARTFLAQRDPATGHWRTLTYAETHHQTRSLAQALLNRNLGPASMVAILSGNSLEHALLALACMDAGIPYTPIAPAYSLASKDLATLRYLWERLEPSLVFAAEGELYESALSPLLTAPTELVTVTAPRNLPSTPFHQLHATPQYSPSNNSPDAVAKVLFTSGSTGSPKGVITTHRMLCSNQEMLRTSMGFLADEPPVLCDWLPWNHVFGGSHNFGLALYNGGTLYIDEGKPTPVAFSATLRNLKEIAPTAYFNVPRGYELLVPELRADPALRTHFFSRLKLLFYAAAGLNQKIWDELQELAVSACGEEILMMTGLGATESAPFALSTGIEGASAGRVGLPVPGVELKLVPVEDKLEARLRGPNITPGFWRNPELTAASFDEEGFYRLGDALLFADPSDPLKGFCFDGRLAEDFKLSTGTWVSVGPLRNRVLTALQGLAQDVVIAGPDRDYVTALIFPLAGLTPETLRPRLEALARQSTGISTRIERALILDQPPSIDAGELTEKGSISQKAVLRHRAALVDELYRGSPRVVTLAQAF